MLNILNGILTLLNAEIKARGIIPFETKKGRLTAAFFNIPPGKEVNQ